MLLFIIRHGKAERTSPSGMDRDRALKDRGMRQAAHLGQWLSESEHGPDRILASDFTRARQTAELINEALELPLEFVRELQTGYGASAALEAIGEAGGSPAVVGHNPQLSELAGILIRGVGSDMGLRTGECVCVRFRGTPQIGSGELIARIRLDED